MSPGLQQGPVYTGYAKKAPPPPDAEPCDRDVPHAAMVDCLSV